MSMTAGLYGRVSDRKQLDGHSIETQLERLRKRADGQLGAAAYQIREYIEEGLSGDFPPEQMADEFTSKTRPALTALLDDAERGLLDIVFFYAVDRLAREKGIFWEVEKRLQRLEIPYRFLDVDVDPTTDEGSMTISIMQLFADLWLRKHKRRIKDAWAKRREEGYPPGGRPPYGMKWQEKTTVKKGERRGWVRDESTCDQVIWMKERYLAGWTTTQIANKLTELGVSRPARRGTDWSPGAVGTILISPFHAGLIPLPDGTTARGQHWDQRLWEPAEWEMMCQRLRRNKRVGSTTVNATHFPLGGIISCGHCGHRLYCTISAATGKRLYQCRTRSHEGKDACKGVGRLAEPIEKAVLGIIKELALSQEIQDLAYDSVGSVLGSEHERLTALREDIEGELQTVKRRSDALFDLRADGELTPAKYAEQDQRLWARREELERQIAKVDADLADQSSRTFELQRKREVLRNFDAVWDALDPAEQQEALRVVVEHAILERAEGEDLNLRVKVAFLPERGIPIPSYTKRKATSGPGSLTPRELAYLKHKQTGLSDRAVVNLFDTTIESVRHTSRDIRKRLGVATVDEAVALAAERLRNEAHALPLSGRANKTPKHRPKIKWTPKLKAIVQGLADGKPRRQLAEELDIKETTLSERIRRMKRAIDAKTMDELLAYAREAGAMGTV